MEGVVEHGDEMGREAGGGVGGQEKRKRGKGKIGTDNGYHDTAKKMRPRHHLQEINGEQMTESFQKDEFRVTALSKVRFDQEVFFWGKWGGVEGTSTR